MAGTAVAGGPPAKALAALREEVASLNPDIAVEAELFPVALGRDAAHGRPGADSEQLRVSLKAQKYQFLEQAEAVAFITKAEKWNPAEVESVGTAAARREQEKAQNKAIKQQIANAEADNQRLLEEVAEEYEKNREIYEHCMRELQGLSGAEGGMQVDSEHGMDIDNDDDFDAMQQQAHNEAMAAIGDVERLEKECQALRSRKVQLSDELQTLDSQKNTWARRARKSRQDEAREARLFAQQMKVLEKESELGLPSLVCDSARGTVVIHPPKAGISAQMAEAVRSVKEQIRTVAMNLDEEGNLLSAEAHPALSLEKESDEAVKHNDISRLILAIWIKLLRVAHSETERRAQAAGS